MKAADSFPFEVMILVGGKGTRLQTVVSDRPKPMAEVAGRPFLEWVLKLLKHQGVQKVVLCTGYLGGIIESHFGDGRSWGMDIEYSCDPYPLGTGGAVRHALDLVENDRFFVLNGDSFCPFDLRQIAEFHARTKALVTMGLVKVDDCRRYGSVRLGDAGTVQEFVEKSSAQGAGLINAGTYLIEYAAASRIPENQACSLETDFFPRLVGCGLYAIIGKYPFLDIGTPESFASARDFILRQNL
jgi:NDP-sugar pyrophosphorylase family protein